MKAKHLLFVAAVAIALLLLRLLLVGPEERIRRELVSIAEEASKTGAEKPIVAAAKARAISGSFSDEAEAVDLRNGQGARGRDSITRAIAWARESWGEGELSFEGLEIELQGEERAQARAQVRILDQAGESVSPHDGTQLRLDWAKIGGSWKIVLAEAETPAQ